MKKVCMVEYQGRCDEHGKAVGHGPKVLYEYYNFIKDICNVKVYAPKVILNEMPREITSNSKVLKKHIVMQGKTPFIKKITNKLGMFSNIKKALKATDADEIWFFNVEYYLMLYLFLHKKPKQKVVCTMFLDGYHGGFVAKVKQWIFEKAQKKIDLIISTGSQIQFKNCEYTYIPDYYYIPEKYLRYTKKDKKEQCVCLGTMGNGKQLEELVKAFTDNGYPLLIAGRFYDKERLAALKESAGNNITIIDEYLSDEEYLTILGESKYVVLPYSPRQYSTQTSGVMQEAIFVDTVVVSYNEILSGNNVDGIGFDSFDKLTGEKLKGDTRKIIESYELKRLNEFSKEKICRQYACIWR